MDIVNDNDYDEYAKKYYNKVLIKLKKIIDDRELAQGHIASITGIAQSTISKMFSGEVKMSIFHIAKICKAINIDPGEIMSIDNCKSSLDYPYDNSNDSTLISDPSHLAFKGYIGEFNVYFNSTISSENAILHGVLHFSPSENNKTCNADMVLYTGKYKNGSEITKHYTGSLTISLSMSSCYCSLVATEIGEMCFFVFDHMFLFNEELACRLACAITTSSGGNRRPTMHRLLLCKDKLDVSDMQSKDSKFLRGHLMLNSSDIIISKTSFAKLKENIPNDNEIIEFLNNLIVKSENDSFYKIDESLIRNSSYSMETKVEMITMLREYSIEKKYNKISSKSDEYVYNYLSNRDSLSFNQ